MPIPATFGWRRDDAAVEKMLARSERPMFFSSGRDLKDDGKGKTVLLHKAVTAVLGTFPIHQQTIGDCFPPSAPVRMEDGSLKPISQIKLGEKVITHRGRAREVTGLISKPYTGSLITAQTETHQKVEATPDHRFVVFDKDLSRVERRQDGSFWKPINRFNIGEGVSVRGEDGIFGRKRIVLLDTRDVRDFNVHCLKVAEDQSFLVQDTAISNCFPDGTLVTMADGTQKPIEDVEIGDMVLSHRSIPRKVTNTFARKYTGEMVTIRAHGYAQDLEATADHKLPIYPEIYYGAKSRRPSNNHRSERLEWAPIGELSEGTRVLIPFADLADPKKPELLDLHQLVPDATMDEDCRLGYQGSVQACNRFVKVDERFCWLIGMYLAEGGAVGNGGAVQFSLDVKETLFAEQILQTVKDLFGIEGKDEPIPSNPSTRAVIFHSSVLSRFFKSLVPGNVYNKAVPACIFRASRACRLAALRGWMDGDGCFQLGKRTKSPWNRLKLTGVSASKALRTDMFRLAMSCKLRPKLTTRTPRPDRHEAGDVHLYGESALAVYPEREVEARAKIKINKASGDVTKLGVAAPIAKITRRQVKNLTVRCIEVEEDHSFIVNNYGCRNCVSHGWGLGIDVLKCVQIFLLQLFQDFVAETCTEAFYAASRVEIGEGGCGYDDGSSGAWAAEAARRIGVVARLKYDIAGKIYDLTKYSGNRAAQWGRPNAGMPDDLEKIAKDRMVQTTSMVQSYEEARDAIANGYPVPVCSDQGFTDTRDADGFARASGSWAHCMLFMACDDNPSRPGLLCMNSWGCYDEETEVLTLQGWKRFRALAEGELVATLNPVTHELEYQRPTKTHRYRFDGEMYKFGGRDIDLMVTPNHNMYVCPRGKDEEDAQNWKRVRADECNPSVAMKKNANWNGEEVGFKEIGKHRIPMDIWLEFLGYFLSEGSAWSGKQKRTRRRRDKTTGKNVAVLGRTTTQRAYNVSVFQSKPEGVKVIGKFLKKFPIKFFPTDHGWSANNKALYQELAGLGKAPAKYIPEDVKSLSRRQLGILYQAMMLGDGSVSFGETGAKRTYYTSSKRLADDFQELLLKIGYAGDISFTDRVGRVNAKGTTRHVEYRVGIKHRALTPVTSKGYRPLLVPYHGDVHCVTVPNHTLYVRRNGKAVWCGNSNWIRGPKRLDQPEGSFWVDAKVADRMLRQRDSYAISNFPGYLRQPLDNMLI